MLRASTYFNAAGITVIAGVVLVTFAAGYKVKAWQCGEEIAETHAAHLEAVAKANEEARKTDELRIQLTQMIMQNDALNDQKREVVERVVTKQVIKYVETDNARECGLSPDGVRIHDTAARGELPEDTDPTGEPDGKAIAATNAQVIDVVASNYGRCNEYRDKLISFQDWAASLARQ